MSKRRIGAIIATLALVAVTAACGSSTKSSSPPGSSSSSAAAPKSEIRIGVIGSYSGPQASSIASGEPAIKAWAAAVNAAGGIDGHPVKLFIQDDKGVVATSVTQVKQLVEEDHVVAIVGQQSPSGASAWGAYVQQAGVPVVGGSAIDTIYLKNPDFFAADGNLVAMFYGISALAKTHGSKYGILVCAEIPACAGSVTIMQSFTPDTGVQVAYNAKLAASVPDFTAQCQAMKEAGVTSYTIALGATLIKKVAAQCAQQGLKATVVLPNNADESFPTQPGLDGLEVADAYYPFFDQSIPAAKEMHDAFAKYSPEIGTAADPSNAATVMAWTSGKLLEAAVKASGESGDVTSDSIKKGLYSLKDETLNGLTQPLNFAEGKPTFHNCYFTYKAEGGKFVIQNDGKPSCASDAAVAAVAAKF